MATYKIELHASTFPAGGGKHYFWILRDPSGKAIREMHGNNSNWVPGSSMPPGSLEFLENDLTKKSPIMPGLTTPYQLNRPEGAPKPKFENFQIYFESPDLDEALKRWNAAIALGEYLNTKNIDYELFSTNSNAMANTLGLAMGFKPTRLSFEGPYLAPGLDIDLSGEYGEGAPRSPYRIGKPTPLLKGGSLDDDGRRKVAALRDAGSESNLFLRPDVAAMTPAAARRAISAAKADDAFARRYVSNDRDAVDYMHTLHRAAYPEPGSDSPSVSESDEGLRGAQRRDQARASAAATPRVGVRDDLAPWMSEATAAARKALTDLTLDSGFVDRYLDGGRKELDRFQGLMRNAYPEPDAADAGGAETGGAASALKPWSPSISSDNGDGVAPWLRDAFTSEATRAPGAEPGAESTIAPWMGEWKPDWWRRSGE